MTEEMILEPLRTAGAFAVRPEQPPVVAADATLKQAAEEAKRRGQRSFIIAKSDQRFLIDIPDLTAWAFSAAEGQGKKRVENQIKLLRSLYGSAEPALLALKAHKFVATPLASPARSGGRAAILGETDDDVVNEVDSMKQSAMDFNRIYVCERGLHSYSGCASPPETCVNGKRYRLRSLDE